MPSVPQELMDRLHQANEQFHRARMRLEGVIKTDDAHRGQTGVELRAAEKELEAVTDEINKCLGVEKAAEEKVNPDSPPGGQTPAG